jgi:hypothetical protein
MTYMLSLVDNPSKHIYIYIYIYTRDKENLRDVIGSGDHCPRKVVLSSQKIVPQERKKDN